MKYILNSGNSMELKNKNMGNEKRKRIVTKIGDVFCVEVDNQIKRYFQYIVNDQEMLNSSVIRIFKTHYPMSYKPVIEDIIQDEVEFYAHTVLKFGIVYNAWYKIGKSNDVGDYRRALFRRSRDYGAKEKVSVSERWDVWHINEPFVYVGKLTKEYQSADLGSVLPYIDIVDRLRYGHYIHSYPDYE